MNNRETDTAASASHRVRLLATGITERSTDFIPPDSLEEQCIRIGWRDQGPRTAAMVKCLRLVHRRRFRVQPFGVVAAGRELDHQLSLRPSVDIYRIGSPRFGQNPDACLRRRAIRRQPAAP